MTLWTDIRDFCFKKKSIPLSLHEETRNTNDAYANISPKQGIEQRDYNTALHAAPK